MQFAETIRQTMTALPLAGRPQGFTARCVAVNGLARATLVPVSRGSGWGCPPASRICS